MVLNVAQIRELAKVVKGYPRDTEMCLTIGGGHSGHGLYVSEVEYPDEGSLFLGAPDDVTREG